VSPGKTALLFPGQGAQHVGMGKELAERFPEAAETFEQADEILGFSLSRLMWDGPQEELTLTANAQPAILVHSVAVTRLVRDDLGDVSMAAGHSLGEYSAHVAADTLSFEEAVAIVRLRGELMEEAGRVRPGSMAAVLGMADQDVIDLCEEMSQSDGEVVCPANFNSEGQVVVSGDRDAVARLMEVAPARGAKRVVPLAVSGAFHSPLMTPAQDGLESRLTAAALRTPSFPVYCNVDATPVTEVDAARTSLIRQLTRPVRWASSIRAMLEDGADRFVELGPGSVLTGLNRRNAKGIDTFAVGGPEELGRLGLPTPAET
jgi:[acyl-carrier-protein] S-malonyltransferase